MQPRHPRNLVIDGKKVAWLRKAKGWTREDLVRKSGCSTDNVDRIEASDAVEVLPRTAGYLAVALGVEVKALLKAETPPSDAGGEKPVAAPTEGLTVRLDVRVWGPDDARRRGLPIRQAGTLPVRTGDNVRVEVEASRRVYLYAVWVTSKGEAQPLYPWEAFDWDRPRVEEKLSFLSLPLPEAAGRLGGWPIDTPPGIETLVVMADEHPLKGDAAVKARGWWAGFPSNKALADLAKEFWFACGKEGVRVGLGEGTRLGPTPVPIDDPIYEIQALLRNSLGGRFDLVEAVSFANVGPGGESA
jgi:transcriptional regulator with XRE-family HTH domain